MPQDNKLQFYVCPHCQGSGRVKYDLVCGNCAGIGVGAFHEGRFLYWGRKLDHAIMSLNSLKDLLDKVINLCFFLGGLVGIAVFGYYAYLNSRNHDFINLNLLFEKNIAVLALWLGLSALLFTYYRLSEKTRLSKKINRSRYDARKHDFDALDNWQFIRKNKRRLALEISPFFDHEAWSVIESSASLADHCWQKTILPIHVFYESLLKKSVARLFIRLNVDAKSLMNTLSDRFKQETIQTPEDAQTNLKKLLIRTYISAYDNGQSRVSTPNFLSSCISSDPILKELMVDKEIDEQKIENVVAWFAINRKLIEKYHAYRQSSAYKPDSAMDRAYTALATPTLNVFAYDMTLSAKYGQLDFCVYRDKELENIFQIFESGQNGVLLVGQPGVGKRSVVSGIAEAMVQENVPKIFYDKRLLELDIGRLVSGASPAQAQERLQAVIDEVNQARNIILFVSNIENMIGISAGGEDSMDLSEILSSAIQRKQLYCIASTTNEAYAKAIEKTPLGESMPKVIIEEPSGNQAIQIIESQVAPIESQNQVFFTYTAIEAAVALSQRYIHDRYLPAKAIDILQQTATKTADKKGLNSLVLSEDVSEVISDLTKIPLTRVTEKESDKLLHLEEKIHERMVGQEEAVRMIASSLRRARANLREGKRPIANFLFLGPTGVGKTELAKTISEVYFGDEANMIRLDMSEYQDSGSASKLIGDNHGAVGHLTEAVRKAPFSLVLLDELEKAHPDIFNLFLQVFDDGRLTDGSGKTIDFTNTIIIATSNVGANLIRELIKSGSQIESIKQELLENELVKTFRPEFINRFDGVIVFKPLDLDDVTKIARLMLGKLSENLSQKGIGLEISDMAVLALAKLGFDPKFGARPLRRVLQDRIEDMIAVKLLSQELGRRDTLVIYDVDNIMIRKAEKL